MKTTTYVWIVSLIIAGSLGYFLYLEKPTEPNFKGSQGITQSRTIISQTDATTTSALASTDINIDGAERVTLAFTVAGVTGTGLATSTFTITVSLDGTNYVTYNKLVDNVTNSISQNLTRVATTIIDSNSTKYYSMDLQHDNFMFLKISDTITGTSTSDITVKMLADY